MSLDDTRRSWNQATRNHNTHKGDQAAFLRAGGDTLFPEELELLGELHGKALVHLQCNAGQDSLCLARRGASVTGVDFSDEAIAFARGLSRDSGLPASFVEAEVVQWLATTEARFELAFSSYGTIGWLKDLGAWARGVHRVLRPGGWLVLLEFHPALWSVGPGLKLDADDYFSEKPFTDPVSDYVARSGPGLGATDAAPPLPNETPATSYQHGVGQVVTALAAAGFTVERLVEYPHSNGCKVHEALVPAPGRRFLWPPGVARLPLMVGVVAARR